jgi:hypothetical protein
MKTLRQVRPALLNPTPANPWLVRVQTRKDWSEMTFSNQAHAQAEYARLRTQGTLGGAWIELLTIEEKTLDGK